MRSLSPGWLRGLLLAYYGEDVFNAVRDWFTWLSFV